MNEPEYRVLFATRIYPCTDLQAAKDVASILGKKQAQIQVFENLETGWQNFKEKQL